MELDVCPENEDPYQRRVWGCASRLQPRPLPGRNSTALTKQQMNGRMIAQKLCADCHAVTRHDRSPTAVNANTAFRDLHKRYPIKMLVDGLSSGTIAGHDEMPAFIFSPSDMVALLSYIDSFAPTPAKTYVKR